MTIVASNSLTVSNVNDGTITHTAYAYSADGTDRFTTVYPNLNLLDGTRDFSGTWGNASGFVTDGTYNGLTVKKRTAQWNGIYKTFTAPKDGNYTFSAYVKASGSAVSVYRYVSVNGGSVGVVVPNKRIGDTFNWLRDSFQVILKAGDTIYAKYEITASGTDSILWTAGHKWEYGSIATPWMTSSSEVTTADWPSYIGQYSDFTSTVSTDPAKYAPWTIFKGNDGVGVKSTVITYAISTSGTTAPSTGWTSSVPTLVKGQYLWTKTAWTYTDTSSKTGYSVTYISKDGTNGTDGTSGIIVSSVAPDNPQTGQLWQDTSTTPQLVKKWTGNEWVIWELYAQNLKADTLETISAKIGKIYNEFDNSSGGIDNKGTITIEDSIKVDYYNGNSRTTMDLVASSSGQGLFTQHLPDKTDTSKFKQAWYTPSYLYFSDTINNWNGQITAENVTLAPWQNLILRSGYTAGDGVQPQYRRIKNLDGSYSVQFRGAISPTSGNFSATQVWAATVTGVYRPPTTAMRQCSDNTGKGVRVAITTDGGLYVMSPNNSSYAYIDSLTYIN